MAKFIDAHVEYIYLEGQKTAIEQIINHLIETKKTHISKAVLVKLHKSIKVRYDNAVARIEEETNGKIAKI